MTRYQIKFKRVYDAPAATDGVRGLAEAYANELAANPTSLTPLLAYARQSTLTLLSAVKDVEHSHLPVLKQAILTRLEDDNEELDHHN